MALPGVWQCRVTFNHEKYQLIIIDNFPFRMLESGEENKYTFTNAEF